LVKTKHVGFLIMVGSPLAMTVYVIGIVYATTFVLQLTACVTVLGALGVLTWIGYSMVTEPPSPEVSDLSESDLQPETINAEGEEHTLLKRPRFSIIEHVEMGENVVIRDHVNLYKCKIGNNCKIESFVYIEEGVTIGSNCKIKPHVFIPTGVTIEDDVFIGPNVTFTNDKRPGVKGDWTLLKTIVGRGASIGADSVVLPGVRIGRNSIVGAGSVVTTDVPDGKTVCGNPARPLVK